MRIARKLAALAVIAVATYAAYRAGLRPVRKILPPAGGSRGAVDGEEERLLSSLGAYHEILALNRERGAPVRTVSPGPLSLPRLRPLEEWALPPSGSRLAPDPTRLETLYFLRHQEKGGKPEGTSRR